MPNTDVEQLKEAISNFGEGDQFQLFFPENGRGLSARIESISFVLDERNFLCLLVKVSNAKHVDENRGLAGDATGDFSQYDRAPLENLSVTNTEPGYLGISNALAEQVIALVKSTHEAFLQSH